LIYANEEFPVIRGREQTEYYSETKVRPTPSLIDFLRTAPY